MSLQAKFFAFVAPVLLATAILPPAFWYVQFNYHSLTPDVLAISIWMTAGLILTALLTVYLAAARLVCRPMRRMARKMNRISLSDKNIEPLAEAARGDELGMAARAFNQVVDAVQWSNRALQASNADLEKRVTQRTEELASRNNQLVAAESRYRSIFENATEGIFQTTADGACLSANPAMVAMLGYDSAEELFRCVTNVASQIYADPAVRETMMQQLLANGNVDQFEAEFMRRDGSRMWASLNARVVRDEQGKPERLEGLIRDITEKKHSEWLDKDRRELLEMIARNEPVTQTLQAVCHAAERQCEGMRSAVLVHEQSRRQIGAAPQLSARFMLAMDEMLNLGSAALSQPAFATAPEQITDIATDPTWAILRDAAMAEGLLACQTLPITAGHGKILGEFILLQSQCVLIEPRNFSAIQSLAGLAGLAVEHHQLTNRLEYDAVHDPLTGLPNRAQLDSQLPQWVGAAARYHRSMAVLMIDLDGFKNYNDTLGHSTGDELLRQVSGRLTQAIRGSDVLVRMGGDEFNLVATEIAAASDADIVADRLIQALQAPFAIDGRELFVTASVGIAVYPADAKDSPSLQRNADAAMYAAKAAGRNRAMRFNPTMAEAATDRLELEGQLRRAIAGGELLLEYQPQVGAGGGIVSAEALVRWEHPRLGRIAPMRFIPLAEQCGLILPIGAWVLREACRQARAWQTAGCPPVCVAVNVSAMQFQQNDFLEIVAVALNETGLDPAYLELELTESLLMANTSDAVEKVAALRVMGVTVAIDDFGTGYSSLAYLRRLPIDRLKIDQSFVNELGDGPTVNTEGGRTAIITAIISLATSLGKRLVAEGVETIAQRDYLIGIGCDTLQGYLFGKPMSGEEIQSRLLKQSAAGNVLSDAA